MVKLESFYVSFDQQWSVYRPGDLVTGSVTLATEERIFADEVRAHFAGTGRVFWVEKELQPPNGLVNVAYSAEHNYFSETQTIWRHAKAKGAEGEASAAREAEAVEQLIKEAGTFGLKASAAADKRAAAERPYLSPGRHVLPFTFQLPEGLPTSFESSAAPAWVRYSVKVSITEAARPKHSRKEFFTVLRAADLATAAGAGRPTVQHLVCEDPRIKEIVYPEGRHWDGNNTWAIPFRSAALCCVGAEGSLGVMLSLQKSGYVPGERILLSAEIDNQAALKTLEVKLRLRVEQLCTAFASTPEHRLKETATTLASTAQLHKIRRGAAFHWEPQLFIPALVPSFIEVELMEVSYQLVVEVFAGKVRPLATKAFPILVGTSPVVPEPYRSPDRIKKPSRRQQLLTPENLHEFPPPSYEESVGGREVATEASLDFLPHYPVFRHLPTEAQPGLN